MKSHGWEAVKQMRGSHIVGVVLMSLGGLLEQQTPLWVLWGIDSEETIRFKGQLQALSTPPTCLVGSCIAWTKFRESTVVTRIASVRPYLNIRKEALS